MKYFTLSADYLAPSIMDADEELELDELDMPDQLRARILEWNTAYQPIIPLTEVERQQVADRIDALDAIGMTLRGELEEHFAPAKVAYYSEGKLRHMYGAGGQGGWVAY
ncbi:hypothetical protein [Parenemella sanctibonifatiensis]|uniref:Uncharacterized protein n=1 Tax=Parenemella sanctibonifatiensis TaxID=2016505 RepID=A0A255EAA3_9ACTN|nr:hypothetical protein [Parenemella sanctibonifatiensis]OYN86425.1 hypothetical protein CGZ92_08730 [Parenemella sanctibonifatiensis]